MWCQVNQEKESGRIAMQTIRAEVPDNLYSKALVLVDQGWFTDENQLIVEAVRRYLEAHEPAMMEQFIREDVEWGLRGGD